jgi:thioredoxin-like negative regulator of GroEL
MLRGVDSESPNEKVVLIAVARNSGRVSDKSVSGLTVAYDKLAEELKDKVNIVAVDCDAHRALCTKNGVKGFPTIKLYVASEAALTLVSKRVQTKNTRAQDRSRS